MSSSSKPRLPNIGASSFQRIQDSVVHTMQELGNSIPSAVREKLKETEKAARTAQMAPPIGTGLN